MENEVYDEISDVNYGVSDKETNVYCPICEACGEEGCCSALNCNFDPKGKYCGKYLFDLRFNYMLFRDLSKYIYDTFEKDHPIFKFMDEIYDKNYDIAYGILK